MEAREMVSASTGAMNSVLSKLAALLVEESNPRTRSSIIALKSALTNMKSFLERRAASTEDMDPLVEGWMNQVRDMTYDLEDCIDDFVHPAAPGDTNRVAQLLKMVKWRRQYTSLLQELKERICEASERRWRYGIFYDSGHPMPTPSDVVPIDLHLPVFSAHLGDGLVCVEGPRDRLIKLLALDDQQQLKMVSIVGSRGIGKTTLAMEVYRSLKERFHCHTVVSVSRCHDLKMILTSILSQVSLQEYDFREFEEGQLIDKLREFLKPRRYFIVIEDIWDVSAWKIIRWAFPQNDCGSRILVTTCIISIASPSCYFNEDHIFQMAPLTDADARRLFFRRIFHPEYYCPLHLEEISSDILKKCGGIPLAIITIASLLATKSEESEWKRVRDGIDSIVDKSATLEGIRLILQFAYFDLPFHLRTCLLYLAIFPEGCVIDKARLIRRWMAEGFITEEHGKSSEELGEFYFNELINRGLIQPVCIQYDGRIEACQVQNMIFDIILSKSAEENFITRYDDRGCSFGVQDMIRRLSLYCDYDNECSFIPSAATASHIRSLTIFMTDKEMPTLANFRALRVLDLESSGELKDANYVQSIGKLCLLKYLRLQTTSFIELPEQVVELQFLQTMDLRHALITRLPCSIGRLKKLTYLLVKNVKLPDGIGELQVLQELSHVEVVSSNSPNSLEDLGRLTMLRVLGLNWCISDTDSCMEICANSLISSLDKLGNSSLQSLHIGSGSGCSLDFLLDSLSAPFNHLHEFRMTSDYYFPRIPEWMTSLVCLKLLEININTVGEEALRILEKLPCLLVLLLSVKSACPNQDIIFRSCGFQRLLQFDFICWNGLDMVMFEQGSMLALEKLHLKFRAKGVLVYYGFQLGIEHIASLRYLRVDIDCKNAEAREVEAAEDVVRGAISAHPGHPILELRKLREEYVVMDELEITVHGEGAECHNDVESEEMVEGELISPDVSRLGHAWWVLSAWWIVSKRWLVSPWYVSPLWVVPTLWVVSEWWVVSQWCFTSVRRWSEKMMGGFLSRILLLVFGYAYPAYKCYKTVELNKCEIEQLIFWCQYWILVALVTGLESFKDLTVSWLPFYSEAKLIFFIYLWYPRTKGTTYIYGTFFKPFISWHENEIDRNLLGLRAQASNVVAFYFQKVATVGQNTFFYILKYVASQSPSMKSKQQRSQDSQEVSLKIKGEASAPPPAMSDDTLETLKEPQEIKPVSVKIKGEASATSPATSDNNLETLKFQETKPVSPKIKGEASAPSSAMADDTLEAHKVSQETKPVSPKIKGETSAPPRAASDDTLETLKESRETESVSPKIKGEASAPPYVTTGDTLEAHKESEETKPVTPKIKGESSAPPLAAADDTLEALEESWETKPVSPTIKGEASAPPLAAADDTMEALEESQETKPVSPRIMGEASAPPPAMTDDILETLQKSEETKHVSPKIKGEASAPPLVVPDDTLEALKESQETKPVSLKIKGKASAPHLAAANNTMEAVEESQETKPVSPKIKGGASAPPPATTDDILETLQESQETKHVSSKIKGDASAPPLAVADNTLEVLKESEETKHVSPKIKGGTSAPPPAAADDTLEALKEQQQPPPQLQKRQPQKRALAFMRRAAKGTQSQKTKLDWPKIFGGASAPSPAVAGNTLEALKDLVQSASVAEQNLLADASRITDRCVKTCKGKAECRRAVADGLRALGYDATVCKSRWDKTPTCPAGEHEYIDTVVRDNVRLIVEVDFRSEFEVARPTKAYRTTLQALPLLFVGTPDRLELIVDIVTEAGQQSLKKKGLHVPPWRKLEYMRAKWLSPRVRTDDQSNELSTQKEKADMEETQV